ncbi:MAG TPA: glycoside hydrolase family 130 protein [Planctomycetota bacterium]|nr:glycoside hydrolase family 130 protein [Planctomycetota bacterium]
MANETVLKRYEGNPIITAEAVPTANTIFNSAAVPFGKGYAGVFRVDTTNLECEMHVGFSEDGIHWKIDPEKIVVVSDDPDAVPGGPVNPYDPRVTPLEGEFIVTWCNYCAGPGPHIGAARTVDFKAFTLIADIIFPYNRNGVIFPRKVGGKYAALHRPSDTGHTPYGDIFYATSPDLVNWGNHHYIFGPRGGWQGGKTGAGPVPIETDEGWLMIYHGVRITCSGYVYAVGAALLDLEKPWKVLYRTKRYLLHPTVPYERYGDVPNVCFPCAAIVDAKTREVMLYYGAADTTVCLATGNLDELIDFVKKNSF